MGKIIGIDLGTTNSCVAVMEGKEPVVIINSEGKRTTPSIVAFADNGERKIGDPAKDRLSPIRKGPFSPSRDLWAKLMTEFQKRVKSIIQGCKGRQQYPRVDIDGRLCSPQEISAMVLQKMKKTAEDYLGQTVTEAVITVPAYFQRLSASGHKRGR